MGPCAANVNQPAWILLYLARLVALSSSASMMPQTSSGADSAEGAETRAVRFAVERELSRVPHAITRIIVEVIKHLDAVGDDWSPMSDGDAETLRRHRTTNDDAV